MALVNIPDQRQWTQPNTSVLFGNIYQTRNIDFSLPGFLKLASRTRYVYREDTAASNFDYVLSIVYGDFGGTTSGGPNGEGYYTVTSDKIFLIDDDLDGAGQLTNSSPPSPSLGSTDAVSWEGGLWVTTSSNLANLTSGTWTTSIMSLTASIPHPLCVAWNNLLLVGNGSAINSRDSGGSNTSNVVTIPDEYRVQWMRSFNKNVWIGTRNLSNGQAKVYQWDGSSENFNNEYEVDCQWIYSGVSWNGNLYIFTNDGRIMSFNGAGFTEVARLPVYTKIIAENSYYFVNGFTLGSVFQRGMAIVDGLVHVLVNSNASAAGLDEDATNIFSSGVWVYDPNIGMTHKFSLTNSILASTVDFGQMAFASGGGALAPVFQDPTSTNVIDGAEGGTLVFGGRVDGGATEYYTFASVTSGENRGFFSTSRIESPEVQESWRYVWLKFEEFENSEDAILLKYRTKYREGLPFTTDNEVTWTSSTTFTSTETFFANVVAGDEVSVVDGKGAGCIAHIASISNNAGTYTVTLDEAITAVAASDTGRVIVDNFHRLPAYEGANAISTATINNAEVGARFAKVAIPEVTATDYQPAPSEWIEVKAELRGENIRISEMAVLSETQTFKII